MVKIYEPWRLTAASTAPEPDDDGMWVAYDDHAAEIADPTAERDRLQAKLREGGER